MKTNHKLTLLAFTAMLSTQAVAADPVLIDTAILQMMTNGFVVGSTGAERIDRGMDDDQIVGGDGADFVKSNTTHYSFGASQTGALSASASPTSSLTTDLNTEVARAASPVGGLPSMSTAGGGWTLMIAGGNGNDTFLPPVNRGMTTDPLGICGGNGNDSIIVGGVGIDYVCSAGTTAVNGAAPGALSFYADSTGAFPLTSPINGAPSSFTNSAGALPLASQANQIIAGAGAGGAPHLTGDTGDDIRTDRLILQLMTSGSFCGDDMDNDDFHGNGDSLTINGDGGEDTLIYGETGSDSLYGGNGADTMRTAPVTNSFVFGTTSY